MPIPKTFSAPGEEFGIAVEDALRYAVWLAHVVDNAMRKHYAYDATNPDAGGVRIVQTWANADRTDQRFDLPQCIISHAFLDSGFAFLTSKQGTKTVIIGVEHLFPYDSAFESDDIDPPNNPTANAVAQRTEMILMRGTLYQLDSEGDPVESDRGILVDPYASPLFTAEDAPVSELIGAYDPSRARYLNDGAPRLTRRTYRIADQMAVSYGVYASYELRITDLERMTAGGTLG